MTQHSTRRRGAFLAAAGIAMAAALTLAPADAHAAAGDDAAADTGVHADTYSQAWQDCATVGDSEGWDSKTVADCRMAAYFHFGYTRIALYHSSTEA